MRFKDHTDLYFDRMDASVNHKTQMLDWLRGGDVAELGPGSGSLTEIIAERSDVDSVLAIDASAEALQKLSERLVDNPKVRVSNKLLGSDSNPFGNKKFDTILASSVLHEVYSFLGKEGLSNLARDIEDSLKPGGLFILRDGVRPDDHQRIARMTVAPRLLALAERYCAEAPLRLRPKMIGNVARGNRHQIAEMAFTITWGEQSFEREVTEQYQVYSRESAADFYFGFGLELVHSASIIQDGYKSNLADCPMESRTEDSLDWEPWFPNTNALWVFKKWTP